MRMLIGLQFLIIWAMILIIFLMLGGLPVVPPAEIQGTPILLMLILIFGGLGTCAYWFTTIVDYWDK